MEVFRVPDLGGSPVAGFLDTLIVPAAVGAGAGDGDGDGVVPAGVRRRFSPALPAVSSSKRASTRSSVLCLRHAGSCL